MSIPDQSIVDYFGVDTCSIYINEARPWTDNGDGTLTDMWGISYRLNPDGYYYNMVRHPLEAAEENRPTWMPMKFQSPMNTCWKDLRSASNANKDKCCILEGLREPMFGLPSWLRRNDNFYVDLMVNEELSDALHEKLLAYYKKLVDFIMVRIGDRIDVVKLADDMGAQNALLMSPDTYRARVKPYQKALYGYIKDRYHKKILLHSCGSIRPIIGDLIEIGVDAINPVQISADDMDPATLKRQFGNNIVFWGGGIDTQHVLTDATPEQVRGRCEAEHVNLQGKRWLTSSPRFTISSRACPIANILAMYEAYRENADY